MKIDIGLIYMTAILACFLFQNFFTSVNHVYDASYYVDGDLTQASFTSKGSEAHPGIINQFISESNGDKEVVIISFQKRESIRVFKPIWK